MQKVEELELINSDFNSSNNNNNSSNKDLRVEAEGAAKALEAIGVQFWRRQLFL